LYVLSPLDLAVSKIARFADNDEEDIAELVRLELTTANAIEQRATSALGGYVGGLAMLPPEPPGCACPGTPSGDATK
jgi:hypothetical protein